MFVYGARSILGLSFAAACLAASPDPASASTTTLTGLQVRNEYVWSNTHFFPPRGSDIVDENASVTAPPLFPSRNEHPVGIPVQSGVEIGDGYGGLVYDMTAFQSPTGHSFLRYSGEGSTGLQANATAFMGVATAFTVSNGSMAQFLDFSFEVTDIFAEINGAYHEDPTNPFRTGQGTGVQLSYSVHEVNYTASDENGEPSSDRIRELFAANLTFWTWYEDATESVYAVVDDVQNMSYTSLALGGTNPSGYILSMDDIVETLELGLFAPGEERTFEVVMRASLTQAQTETSVSVGMGDPFSFGGTGGIPAFRSEIVAGSAATVPLPAAGWLLFGAFGGLGLLRRIARRRPA